MQTHTTMGLAYGSKDNYDKAIECYQKAININPECAVTYYNMGVAYYGKELETTAADYLYQTGLLYLKQNKRKKVLITIDCMKNLVSDSPLIQKLLK